jgi:putative metallohydrolase (TIGR04338 family)
VKDHDRAKVYTVEKQLCGAVKYANENRPVTATAGRTTITLSNFREITSRNIATIVNNVINTPLGEQHAQTLRDVKFRESATNSGTYYPKSHTIALPKGYPAGTELVLYHELAHLIVTARFTNPAMVAAHGLEFRTTFTQLTREHMSNGTTIWLETLYTAAGLTCPPLSCESVPFGDPWGHVETFQLPLKPHKHVTSSPFAAVVPVLRETGVKVTMSVTKDWFQIFGDKPATDKVRDVFLASK